MFVPEVKLQVEFSSKKNPQLPTDEGSLSDKCSSKWFFKQWVRSLVSLQDSIGFASLQDSMVFLHYIILLLSFQVTGSVG